MKIVGIDLWHVSIPTPKPHFRPSWIPGFLQTENRCTLIRLRTQSGLEGWAAGAAIATERQGLGSLLGPYFLGERADDIASIRQRIREMGYLGQRAGWIEPACWDIVGKARGKPVWQLLRELGGARNPPPATAPDGGAPVVKLYASTGEVRPAAERARECEARLAEGFEAIKLRVHAATLEEDVALVRDVRKAIGPKPILGVDANQGWRVAVVADAPRWDLARARAFCRAAEEASVSWVEEPLAMDAYDDLATLRAETAVDLSGGELNSQGLPEFGVMIEKRCFDLFQPDATFTGGVAETWKILRKIEAAGGDARYTPHTWTNGVGFAVNLAVYGASPWRDETLLEYPLEPPGWTVEARDGLLKRPWTHEKGTMRLPTAPGLGFEIDPRALRRHGKRFFKASKLRVALGAVWEKGLKVARTLGATRDKRLADRDAALRAGGDPARDGLTG